ncbi:MAG TPA: radical SAM/SPASM domain-containing protein [Bacteroidetes bacterium]|nr:radical SAM/SPASM domain-containing protein [Bacteroidota bacterium]
MPIRYHHSQRGIFREFLFRLRKLVPTAIRISVWKWTSKRIFHRAEFADSVPFFKSIELETRTRCNSSCSFCAASILTDKRPDIYMPDVLYEKIIEELALRAYDGNIKFFVNNEPLLDKRTPDFIRMAKARVPQAKTEVHTNGLKLNPRSGRELLAAGLDILVINNYSKDAQMHRGVRAFLDEVAPDFPACSIDFHQRKLEEQLLNRGGTAPNGQLSAQALPLPCILPFEEMVVTADGRVTICCQDHYFTNALGNLNQDSLATVWQSEGYQKLRKALAASDRSQNPLCKVCDFKGYKEEHMPKLESTLNRAIGGQMY